MKEKIIVTHDGGFHADDVFAVAAILIFLKGEAKVVRTRDKDKIADADFVVDVGGVCDAERNRFDHHMKEGAPFRASLAGSPDAADARGSAKIPYASFGLVWKKFGEEISQSKEAAEIVDRFLVASVDAEDSGVAIFTPCFIGSYPYEVSDAIRAFMPTWKEANVSSDARFTEAVSSAQKIIEYEVVRARSEAEGRVIVEKAYRDSDDKRLVILDGDYPFEEILARFPEPLFAVHPRSGAWYLECVRDEPQGFVNRKNLPDSWAGLRGAELADATGVSDAVFCHTGKFMAVAKTRGGAIGLAKIALAQMKNTQK